MGALRSEARWLNFETVRGLTAKERTAARAQEILDDLAAALAADEVNRPLEKELARLTARAGELISSQQSREGRTTSVRRRGWTPWHTDMTRVDGASGYAEKLAELAAKLERQIEEGKPTGDLRLEVSATVYRREPGEE